MNYWLMKTEPETFSWQDLAKQKRTLWDGVRNYQARNNMMAMKKGDKVLIYHSVSDKCVVGIAVVSKEFFPDPTTDDKHWVAVELIPDKPLKKTISLEQIKSTKELAEMKLIKQSRLSVMPVTKAEFNKIISLGS
ncbi:MAG: EVE domain-containing protein [Flavobacteriales bacterium]|nr:EVE domain-containing protein [Flavobacteriales bacterium]